MLNIFHEAMQGGDGNSVYRCSYFLLFVTDVDFPIKVEFFISVLREL